MNPDAFWLFARDRIEQYRAEAAANRLAAVRPTVRIALPGLAALFRRRPAAPVACPTC